jgi:hypothetical protein
MVPILENHGRFWSLDPEGFIANDAAIDRIEPAFERPVAAVRDAYLEHLGDAIDGLYLRGSIPRGLALSGASDVDSFALTSLDPDTLDLCWAPETARTLQARYPQITEVDFSVYPVSDVERQDVFSELALLLETQSICLSGRDLTSRIPSFRPDAMVANCDICQIEADLDEAVAAVSSSARPETTRTWARRISKNIVRTGFSLTMLEHGRFTRDLVPCWRTFASHHPAKSDAMRTALEYAIEPPDDAGTLLAFLQRLGPWLIAEADAWMAQHNPLRELALPFVHGRIEHDTC